jgi:hypothetical protein
LDGRSSCEQSLVAQGGYASPIRIGAGSSSSLAGFSNRPQQVPAAMALVPFTTAKGFGNFFQV